VRDFYRNTTKKRKEKRRAIGDEKRKWGIRFYTPSGKPDKLRRPGRPWDPSAFAGPEKMTFCPAVGVDLLALGKPKLAGLKGGSKESLDQVMNEVTLNNYLQQTHQYETLLTPIYDIMQGFMGAPPGGKAPQENGFGPIGRALPMALEEIDAIPATWREDRERLERLQQEEAARIEKERFLKEDQQEREDERQLLLKNHLGKDLDDISSSDLQSSVKLIGSGSRSSSRRRREEKKPMDKEAQARAEKRKQRIKDRAKGPATIPWKLLDQLEAERVKFEGEKAFLEFYHPV
jgi:hypothetical protein